MVGLQERHWHKDLHKDKSKHRRIAMKHRFLKILYEASEERKEQQQSALV